MTEKSSDIDFMPGGWKWVDDHAGETELNNEGSRAGTKNDSSGAQNTKKRKHWGPRTCRICLEIVSPTFHTPSENLPGILQGNPYVTYESEAGKLLRPCQCKGSSRYVHESCLQEWRHADPAYGKRNYWRCPICNFQYSLERLNWGRWVSSKATQLALTLVILVVTIFLLGFLADPIINMYLDPLGTITYGTSDDIYDGDADWITHFVKGFASLGLLGFAKMFFTISPFHWISTRSSRNFGGGRPGTSGRDRVAGISWFVILIGIVTFLLAVWKGVRAWSRRVLEKAGEKVRDVQGDDDGDELDESEERPT